MTGLKVMGLVAAMIGIPAVELYVAQIPGTEGAVKMLAAGSAQTVLSVIAVALTIALYKGIRCWREDMAQAREDMVKGQVKNDQMATQVLTIVAANTAAMEVSSKQGEKTEVAMHRVANVIEKYEKE